MQNNFDSKETSLSVDLNEATLAVKESRFADALKTLKINLSRYPDHIDSLYLAAVSARYLKKYDDAKKYIEIALSISPNNHYIMDSMGWLHFRMGNIEIALQFIEKAYKIQKDPEIAAHLGEILWKMGKLKQAEKVWEESIKTYPSNTVLLETFERLR